MHPNSLLVSIVIYFTIFLNISFAKDLLNANQCLKDGETLISPKNWFQVGFFSKNNSTRRFLGIWYTKTPTVIVWVANRNNPVLGKGGSLTLRNEELAIVDKTGKVFWSSGWIGKNPLAIKILDTGNLIVKNEARNYIWESFQYPTDTRLPGMRMGLNGSYLNSWKSDNDPSMGKFVYRFDFRVLPQLIIEEGMTRRLRLGPCNGLQCGGAIPFKTSLIQPAVLFVDNENSGYVYQPYSSLVATRLQLSPSGSLDFYLLDQHNQWIILSNSVGTNDQCNKYGRCGPNGFCKGMRSSCQCLEGFTPKFPHQWNLLDWFGGCVRKEELKCNNRDKFLKLVGFKYPDLFNVSINKSLDSKQCEALCLNNCSCTAYANSNVTSGGSGCLLWFGNLMDMRDYSLEDTTQVVHLRLSASELRSSTNKERELKVVKLAVIPIVVTLTVLIIFWFLIRMMRRGIKRNRQRMRRQILSKEENNLLSYDYNLTQNISKVGQLERLGIPLFSFSSVAASTDNFSSVNILGVGGFGSVYKGRLQNGDAVAVKRMKTQHSSQGYDELRSEAMVAKLQHQNLVKIIGCCIEGNENIIIYEFLPNKSLDKMLFASENMLNWNLRVKIIEGIAQGLLYLHEHSRLKIIHRDLKIANVLLDKDMNPKISDFGLAKIYQDGENITVHIAGTWGYMSPEYLSTGEFSIKSDVYAFGVMLLEIISGKKVLSFFKSDDDNGGMTLIPYAWRHWISNPLKLKDSNLQDADDDKLRRYINIALLCIQTEAIDRPSMSDVVAMLKHTYALPNLKLPSDFEHQNFRSPASVKEASVNNVTLSILQPRP